MSDNPSSVAVILVGVGPLPGALLSTAEVILGDLAAVTALSFAPDTEPGGLAAELAAACAERNQGRGVLLIADLCGSSLANACYELARGEDQIEVLSGANLAMLMKLYGEDRAVCDPTELARRLAHTARRCITIASERRPQEGEDAE